jgi:hypothetical protein
MPSKRKAPKYSSATKEEEELGFFIAQPTSQYLWTHLFSLTSFSSGIGR